MKPNRIKQKEREEIIHLFFHHKEFKYDIPKIARRLNRSPNQIGQVIEENYTLKKQLSKCGYMLLRVTLDFIDQNEMDYTRYDWVRKVKHFKQVVLNIRHHLLVSKNCNTCPDHDDADSSDTQTY